MMDLKDLILLFFGVTYLNFCLFDKAYGRLLTGFLIKNILYILTLLGFMYINTYLERILGVTITMLVFLVSYAYIGYRVYFIVDSLVDKLYKFFGR